MKTEIIAVGTELLLGQIVDTNSSWMGEQLALAGIDSHYQTKVGDNFERIADAFRLALDRSDAVLVCGGLGPTQDDITRDVLAAVMGVDLVVDERIADRIRSMFASRSRPMPPNNLRQAMVPVGALPIPQQPGTAAGLVAPIRWVPGVGAIRDGEPVPVGAEAFDRVVYVMPGVPYEMREMMTETVLGDLQRRAGVTAAIESRVLRTWGQSESGLAEMLAGRIAELDDLGNPTLAFLASGIEGIKVRITAKGADRPEARRLIEAEQAKLEDLLGDLVFAYDDDNMEMAVLAQLSRLGLTLGVVETITGGRMANRLSSAEAALRTGILPTAANLGDPGLATPADGGSHAPDGPTESKAVSAGDSGDSGDRLGSGLDDRNEQAEPTGHAHVFPGACAGVFAGGIVVGSADVVEYLLQAGSQAASQEATPGAGPGDAAAPPVAASDGAAALARAARLRLGTTVGIAVTAAEDPSSASPASLSTQSRSRSSAASSAQSSAQSSVQPTAAAEHQAGTAFLAVSIAAQPARGEVPAVEGRELADEVRLPGDRERLADYSAISVLNLLRLALAGRR